MMVYDAMRMKKADPRLPQPQEPEYYGHGKNNIDNYCETVKERHPHVIDPMREETDEESLLLSGGGLPHGRLPCLNQKVKPTLTTSYTRLKASHPKDSPHIPPPRQTRRATGRDTVSFPHSHPLFGIR
jgi:hypothetical protein